MELHPQSPRPLYPPTPACRAPSSSRIGPPPGAPGRSPRGWISPPHCGDRVPNSAAVGAIETPKAWVAEWLHTDKQRHRNADRHECRPNSHRRCFASCASAPNAPIAGAKPTEGRRSARPTLGAASAREGGPHAEADEFRRAQRHLALGGGHARRRGSAESGQPPPPQTTR